MAKEVESTNTTTTTSTDTTSTNAAAAASTTEVVATETKVESTETSVADKLYDNKEVKTEEKPAADAKTDETKTLETDPTKTDATKVEEKKADETESAQTYELTVPEKTLMTESDIAQVKTFAKNYNLSKEQAQELLDSQSKSFSELKSRQDAQLVEQTNQWKELAKADPEIGGAKLDHAVQKASQFLDKVGMSEIRTLLNDSGLGNHPTVIKMFARSYEMIADDKFVPAPKSQAGSGKSLADKLYGSVNQ